MKDLSDITTKYPKLNPHLRRVAEEWWEEAEQFRAMDPAGCGLGGGL